MVGDEEAVSEMLSNFPSDDRDPFVTRSMLALTEANLRAEVHKQTAHLVMWMVGTGVAMTAIAVTALGFMT